MQQHKKEQQQKKQPNRADSAYKTGSHNPAQPKKPEHTGARGSEKAKKGSCC